jgi:demethylmenaquinone methyltransferase / 2-methoxy-6-polyprenyl-1,4-benzoquinol methylase
MDRKAQVKPYNNSDDHKSQVRAMFNNIAPSYDGMNRLLSLGVDKIWRRQLVKMVAQSQPRTLLDMATGTADIAMALSKNVSSLEKIVGVDLSERMIELGKQKCQSDGSAKKVFLEVGDAEKLRFENNTFDAITVGFGVRNFSDLVQGVGELARVLKPGGKLWILEFSQPDFLPVKFVFEGYFRFILPLLGRWGSKDAGAYRYLYNSVQSFPQGEDLWIALSEVALEPLFFKKLTFGICCIYCLEKR